MLELCEGMNAAINAGGTENHTEGYCTEHQALRASVTLMRFVLALIALNRNIPVSQSYFDQSAWYVRAVTNSAKAKVQEGKLSENGFESLKRVIATLTTPKFKEAV